MARSWPKLTLTVTPLYRRATAARISDSASPAFTPPSTTVPMVGIVMVPLRSMVARKSISIVPQPRISSWSPGPSWCSAGTGAFETGAKVEGELAKKSAP